MSVFVLYGMRVCAFPVLMMIVAQTICLLFLLSGGQVPLRPVRACIFYFLGCASQYFSSRQVWAPVL